LLAPPTTLDIARFESNLQQIMTGNEAWADEVERIVTKRNKASSMSADTRDRLNAIVETTEKELTKGLTSPKAFPGAKSRTIGASAATGQ